MTSNARHPPQVRCTLRRAKPSDPVEADATPGIYVPKAALLHGRRHDWEYPSAMHAVGRVVSDPCKSRSLRKGRELLALPHILHFRRKQQFHLIAIIPYVLMASPPELRMRSNLYLPST